MRRVVIVLLAALAAGCGTSLPRPTFAPQATGFLVEVDQVPPPARVEVVPPRPAEDAVWVDGEWLWRRGRWAWLTGRWVKAPAGARFCPWAFVRGDDGRLWFAAGTWRDAGGTVLDLKPLAMASVEAGAVVDADGATETTGPIVHDRPHPTSQDAPVVGPGQP
jgi:hypothetical protein